MLWIDLICHGMDQMCSYRFDAIIDCFEARLSVIFYVSLQLSERNFITAFKSSILFSLFLDGIVSEVNELIFQIF